MSAPHAVSTAAPVIAPSARSGVLLSLLSALSFSTLGIWGKLASEVGLNSFTALAWRFVGVVVLLLPLTSRGLTWRARGKMAGVGVVYALATTLYFGALDRISAGTTSLLLYLAPAFVVLLGWAVLGRKPGGRQLGAVALAGAGLALVIGIPGAGDQNALGLGLAAGAGFLYALYLLASERWLLGVSPVAATAHMALVSGVWFTVLAGAEGQLSVPTTWPQWGVIGGMALVSTIVAVPALYGAIARLGAARASLLGTLEPLFTVLLAFLILDEPLRPAVLLGGLLILGGAVLAQGRRGKG
ncbi:DMT family transporter [Deinococcus sp. QL22]|uniref:DMT family transporter n=1 Tax=Deinococcus sp. QL22 TaxID=2939437 RepID=UPI0020183863|nr:DMT family transporter [Deinococcus sp. QL22]UQN05122.1 DMT family transporter [Deinococcus sp. QL22]